MDELTLDLCFWREVSTSAGFQQWLLSKADFGPVKLKLVTDEKWHQRWYRDPVTKRDSETDILLIFRDEESSDRYALHIENKPDHRHWEPEQAENYAKRALDRMEAWNYVAFRTILLAPTSFLVRCAAEARYFDVKITYEEVGAFVPEFLGSSIEV